MICIKAQNLTQLSRQLIDRALDTSRTYGAEEQPAGSAYALGAITALAENCTYDIDISDVSWMTHRRWGRLINDYIDPLQMQHFIKECRKVLKGVGRSSSVVVFRFNSPKKHTFGGCVTALYFQGFKGNKPRFTLVSRTCYIGYMSFLDLGIVPAVAELVEPNLGSRAEFVWHIAMGQVHYLKCIPYIHMVPRWKEKLDKYRSTDPQNIPHPWRSIVRIAKVMDRKLKSFGTGMILKKNTVFAPMRRVSKRWLEHQGKLPKKFKSLHSNQLILQFRQGRKLVNVMEWRPTDGRKKG